MKRLIIDIEVHNIIEIIRKRKGRIPAFLAKYLLSEDQVHQEVEDRIVNEIQENLEKTLRIRLHQEGIRARLTIRQAQLEQGNS